MGWAPASVAHVFATPSGLRPLRCCLCSRGATGSRRTGGHRPEAEWKTSEGTRQGCPWGGTARRQVAVSHV
eukprot:12985753-Alexandrium_andersonii.AAC.1